MNAIIPFSFENNHRIRTLLINDQPWFVAVDVCKALTIGNGSMALVRLDDDEKGVSIIDTLGGKQEIAIINESGLYSLILRSRKPEAKRFKKWVTSEVLPSIRQTGRYEIPRSSVRIVEPLIDAVQLNDVKLGIRGVTQSLVLSPYASRSIQSYIAKKYGSRTTKVDDLPMSCLRSLARELDEMRRKAEAHFAALVDMESRFINSLLGRSYNNETVVWQSPVQVGRINQQLTGVLE